jgi:hypothetical protein
MLIYMTVALMLMNSTSIHNIEVNSNDIILQQDMEYTKIRMSGYEMTDQVGAPELPAKAVCIALPYGAQVTGIRILDEKTSELKGEFLPSFVHPPYILSQKSAIRSGEPDQDIYSSNMPYPESKLVLKGSSVFDNYQICELLFYPVQYSPQARSLKITNSLTFEITYQGGTKRTAHSPATKSLVLNPQDIIYSPAQLQTNQFEYLIITHTSMDTVFQRLADWKTKKGIKTEIRTTDWVYANYTGEDNAATIRNYLKTLPDSSVKYVLLGGDTDIIPCRFAYAMTCSAGIQPGREDTMPADLYFADLQGSWDYDNDGSYGEVEDSIDLYPDLIVGRAPAGNFYEAQYIVNKILTYEKTPELGYEDDAMFSADILWSSPYTDMGVHKNAIEDESFPGYYNITKLYHSQGNLSPTAFKNALRQGQGLINHDGHGWINTMGAGTGYLHNADFDTLTNAPRFGILTSIGCWTAAYDYNCIAESYVTSANGGGVAFLGNSSYGWGSPGNPGHGYSDRFDSRLYYSLLQENHYKVGDMLAYSKIHYIPYSREKNVYRWHQYELNLLGDPEMPVWTDIPETLVVSYPQTIPQGSSSILTAVKDKATDMPVKDALVCLMKGSESYAAGYTDASGCIFLDANAASSGDFDLTVTSQNHLPEETTIPVITGSYVDFLAYIIEDSLGNGDGILNPYESAFIDVIIKNTGNATATSIQMTLRTLDPLTTIQDSTESVGSLNVGESLYIANAFQISSDCAVNGYGVHCDLEITDAARTINYSPTILIGTPVFEFNGLVVSDPPAMPGDTEDIYLEVANTGYGYAHDPLLVVTTSDPYIAILNDSVISPDIDPETTTEIGPFSIAIDPACPQGHHPQLSFLLTSETYSHGDDFQLIVGQTGFFDDMESGSSLWTTAGTNNLWHISTRRAFSQTHAWYCGDENSGLYVNNMNCYIQTIPFMINTNSILKFQRWFHVPLYGTDGIYVIIMGNGYTDTLDFIGTGGALGNRGIQSEWFEEKFSLAQYPGGDTIQVRIAFISDNGDGVSEGFYIDDFNAEHVTYIEENPSTSAVYETMTIHPNPFKSALSIKISNVNGLLNINNPAIKIYDVTGRTLKQYSADDIIANDHIIWPGTDEQGRRVPAGVYFIRLETATKKITKKAILLK